MKPDPAEALADLRGEIEDVLLLVGNDFPPLVGVGKADLEKIGKWAGTLHFEAADNDCRARCAPKALRQLLPADHYLQRWRMPQKPKRNKK